MSSEIHIQLTRGLCAVVDAADAPQLQAYRWHAVPAGATFYAARREGSKTIYMHRQLLGLIDQPRDVHVDHDDGNGLNNRRTNIKACAPAENARKRRSKNGPQGLRGVYRNGRRFVARIGVSGEFLYLGSFSTRDEASAAYQQAARVYFGAFAPKAGV